MAYILCEKVRSLEPYEPVSGTYNIRLDANESCYQLPESLKADIQKLLKMFSLTAILTQQPLNL